MTRADLKQAIAIAVSDKALPGYLSPELWMFEGFGTHNRRIIATMEQFAALVRGQAVMGSGSTVSFCSDGMAEIETLYKRVDLV